jgi:hypothetical protein
MCVLGMPGIVRAGNARNDGMPMMMGMPGRGE